MKKNDQQYNQYIQLLKDELVPAMGCTEPIAIAYLASYAKDVLNSIPQRVEIEVSGNILKNVKSVIVPNTDKMKGIQAAIAAGIVCGNTNKSLEVIANVKEEDKIKIKRYMEANPIIVKISESNYIFDLFITVYAQDDYVKARIVNSHMNLVYVAKNGEILINKEISPKGQDAKHPYQCTVKDIVEFASLVDLAEVNDRLALQVSYNYAIAQEGIHKDYGANIGKVLLQSYGDDIKIRAKALAAAASDARMNGCELPVIIVSGSGNQGIAASVPVIEYAIHLHVNEEELYRALIVSNLVTIHQKRGIGKLSAFCGAVSAGIGSGAGIAYLYTKDYLTVAHTIVNGLGIVSGIVCDGAKASCAAKIAFSVEAGILGYYMYREKQQFKSGDGLIVKGVENTILNIARLASEGMRETDKEIIRMMMKEC